MQVEARDDGHARTDDLAHAREQLAFAIVEMFGDHRAVQVEIDAVDRPQRGQAREHVADDSLEGIARDVRGGRRGTPHESGRAMPECVQRADRACRGNVGAGQARCDAVASDQRRPAAAVLERRVPRLRRRERVGFVLESTDGDQAHRHSRAAWHGALARATWYARAGRE